MKKLIGILTVITVALCVFGIVTKRADANRALFNTGSQDERELAKQISLGVLRDRAAQRTIGNIDEYEVIRVEIDSLGMAHTHVKQRIGGVPVWEGEAIVHLKGDGSLSNVTDSLIESVAVGTTPSLTEKQAYRAAISQYRGKAELTDEPSMDLYIYRGETRDHLVYRVQTPRLDGSSGTSIPVKFIDAHTGELVFEHDNLQTGTGNSLYSGTVTISTSTSAGTFYMEDPTIRRQGTFNMNNTGNTTTGTGGTQSRYTGTDDIWGVAGTGTNNEDAGVDAHYGAAMTYDYYQTVHGRNGINGANGPGTTTSAVGGVPLVVSRVHFGNSYNNAFWFNNQMTYGDGNGTTFSPLVTLDIAGHEMTHGVTEYTANLTYANESGALNESMSDVFGAMVELFARGGAPTSDTWKIGEQSYTPATAGDALRYMDNPHLAGNGGFTTDDDPDHYSERYTGTADSGGVHINSGIANKAFYLASVGGTHHLSGVTVTGIGTTDAARIWYRALTVYMTASTNFAGARTATINAANDLFGSTSAQATTIATTWCAVGVGSCPGATPTPTPPPGTNLFVNGGFEGSASPWVGSGNGYFYIANGAYPQGGTGYIYFGTANNRSGQSYQTVAIPTTATGTLSFWLNVTSSETTTTTQYDKLFVEVRNTSGTLLTTLATYSNLNKAAAGVYTQRTLTVPATYKGQTVRIQFRSTTDSSLVSTFRVDTASLQ